MMRRFQCSYSKALRKFAISLLALTSTALSAQTLSVTPAALAFDLLPTGASTELTATVINTGAASATITAIDLGDSAVFERAGGTCATAFPTNLAGNASCTVSVRARPFAQLGAAFGALNVRAGTVVASTPISATITNPPRLSATSINFGVSPTTAGFSAQRIELLNNNSYAVTLTGISGTPVAANNTATTPTRFLTTGSCFTSLQVNAPLIPSLAAGAKCSMDILPVLPVTTGTYNSNITIATSEGPSSLSVFARIGATPDALVSNPTAIALGAAPAGASVTKLVTLTNSSSTETTVEALRLPDGIEAVGTNCTPPDRNLVPFTIATQSKCSLLIKIALPNSLGAYSTGIDLTSAKGNLTIPVTATIAQSSTTLTVAPAALDFGMAVPDGGTLATRYIFPTLSLTYTNTTSSVVRLIGVTGGATASAGNNALAWFRTSGSCYANDTPDAPLIEQLAPGARCSLEVSVQSGPPGNALGAVSWNDVLSLVTSAGVSSATVTAVSNSYFRFYNPGYSLGALEAQPGSVRLTRLTTTSAADSRSVSFFNIITSNPTFTDTINFVAIPAPFTRSGGTCPTVFPAQATAGCTMTFSVPANALPATTGLFTATAVIGFARANRAVDLELVTGIPAATSDQDNDGITYSVEVLEGRDPYRKDNAIFAGLHPNSNRWFAMQQYRDFLGREADTSGLADWTSRLATNAMSREAVVQGFFGSPEFQAGVPSVVRLYLGFFNRIPDSAGLKDWVDRFRAGTPIGTIASSFVRSEEFFLTYGGLTNEQFVTLVYRNVLGRAPDPAGFADWLARLGAGLSRGDMMVGFTESSEYQIKTSPNVFVIMMYEGLLRRAAEPAGYQFWVDYVKSGKDALDLTRGFIYSQEYRNRFLP